MLVLIVDSSIQIIERLEEIIPESGSKKKIHKALTYEEAKNLFSENKHQVVLLDIDLPRCESLKLLKEIKIIHPKTCVMILFTYMNDFIKEQCKTLGADFFFDKYYEFEKICGQLKML